MKTEADLAAHFGLLLGSNTGDDGMLQRACAALERSGRILGRSHTCRLPSLDPTDASLYYNQAVLFGADLSRADLAARLKDIERGLGRDRGTTRCVIDIDLVGEYDSSGRVLWSAPHKLAHPVFHDLLGRAWRNAFGGDPPSFK